MTDEEILSYEKSIQQEQLLDTNIKLFNKDSTENENFFLNVSPTETNILLNNNIPDTLLSKLSKNKELISKYSKELKSDKELLAHFNSIKEYIPE
jgi:hypothetical protein